MLGRGVYGYSPNKLHPFECHLLSQLTALRCYNLRFLSVQAQLVAMTTFVRSYVPGAPDWLDRKVSDGMVVVEQQIPVDGCTVAPLFLPTPFYTCAITYQEEVVGEIRLEVPSSLYRVFLDAGTTWEARDFSG